MKRNDDVRAFLRETAAILAECGMTAQASRCRGLARRMRVVDAAFNDECRFETGGWCDFFACRLSCAGFNDRLCPLSRGPIVVRRDR